MSDPSSLVEILGSPPVILSMMEAVPVESRCRDFRSSKYFIYTVVNLAVFTDAYLYGLIIPVLPFALTEVANVPEIDVQWWIGILLATYGAGLLFGSPIAGYFADRTGSRRVPYLLGLIALAASTIMFSIGKSTVVLVIGRIVQGASSASVHAVGMAILADTVGEAGIGPVLGFVSMSIALGTVFGPMVGGFLYHKLGYLAVFVSAYALIALDFLLRILMIEKKNGTADCDPIKPNGSTYGTLPEIEVESTGVIEASPRISRSFTGCLTPPRKDTMPFLDDDSLEQKNRRHPLSELLSSPRMLAALLGDFMNSTILTGLESILPLRIKLIFSYNSKDVALIFLILSLPSLAAPAVGHLSDKYGAKIMVSLGFVTVTPLIILLRQITHNDSEQVVLLCILLLFIGIALNMILTPVFSEAMYLVDEKEAALPGVFGTRGAYAQAFGLMNMAYAAGSLVGPLVGGLLVRRVGWNVLTLGTGVVCAVCVVPCLYATGGRRVKDDDNAGAVSSVGQY